MALAKPTSLCLNLLTLNAGKVTHLMGHLSYLKETSCKKSLSVDSYIPCDEYSPFFL